MLQGLPVAPAALGCVLGLLALALLVCAHPYLSQCKRSKTPDDSRLAVCHLGFLTAGFVMLCTGIHDFWNIENTDVVRNRLSDAPIFSIALGGLLILCGVSATFSSIDNKSALDIKFLSVSWLWLAAFAVWDRARPPLFNLVVMCVLTTLSSIAMIVFPDVSAIISFVSLFGFILVCGALELGVGYGPVAEEQRWFGYTGLFLSAVGAYIQTITFDMSSIASLVKTLVVCSGVSCVFGLLQGSVLAAVVGCVALGALTQFPQFSGLVGSWSSVIGMLMWWVTLRARPGNAPMYVFDNYEVFAVLLLALFKLNIRRLLAIRSQENITLGIWVENLSIFAEKFALCAWGSHLMFAPTGGNFLFDTVLCWTQPAMPSFSMNLYYLVNMASSLEDVTWWVTSGTSTPRYFSSMTARDYRNRRDRDSFDNKLIGVYHLLMSGFLVGSYYSDHVKIGTILLCAHHLSDSVHYLWRMAQASSVSALQSLLLGVNIFAWVLCRGWVMVAVVMYSVMTESKSFRFESDCWPGECSWTEAIERVPLLAVMINLLFVNSIWLVVLCLKWSEQPRRKPLTAATSPTSGSASANSSSASLSSLEMGGSVDCGVSSCMRWGNPISALLRHR